MADDDDGFIGRRGRQRRGPRDGDDRIARIARWLVQRPKVDVVTELVLELESGDVLQRWPAAEAGAELANHINAIMEDAASDAGCTVGLRLAWKRENGDTWLSKGFRAMCREDDRETVRDLDGTAASMLQQNQRHIEALGQQVVMMSTRQDERWERVLGLYERTIEQLADRVTSREVERDRAKSEADEALELAAEAAAAAEAAEQRADDAAAAKDDTLSKVIDIGIKQLTAQASGAGK